MKLKKIATKEEEEAIKRNEIKIPTLKAVIEWAA